MTPTKNTITGLFTAHILENGDKVGIVRFADMRSCLRHCAEKKLYCRSSDTRDGWRYGNDFPNREKTLDALKSGRIVQRVLREYDRQRALIG